MELNTIIYKSNDYQENTSGGGDVEDDDYEYEDVIVYADFESKLMPDELQESQMNVEILGGETETPIIQINNKLFKGKYENAMGTNVFFKESNNSTSSSAINPTKPSDPYNTDKNYEIIPEKMFEIMGKTNKILKMDRIFIKRKDCVDNNNNGEDTGDESVKLEKENSSFDNDDDDDEDDDGGNDKDIAQEYSNLKITKSYQEALDQFLAKGQQPPRKVDNSGNIKKIHKDNNDVK